MQRFSDHMDNELLRLLAGGERDAFDVIYNRYWLQCYQAAHRRLRNADQCKDIVQDIFIDLWQRRRKLAIENLRAYLLGAVRFQVLKTIAHGSTGTAFFEPFDYMLRSGFGADGSVMDKELASLFEGWLLTLPPKRKEIFEMHFGEQLSVVDIAARLGISQKTVQNQLSLSAGELRSKLVGMLALAIA